MAAGPAPYAGRTAGGLPIRRPQAPRNRPDATPRTGAQDDLLATLRPQGNGLARRVPGAQLPNSSLPNLRRGAGPAQPPPPSGAPGRDDTSLHDLLSQFSDGLDRKRRAEPPPDDAPER